MTNLRTKIGEHQPDSLIADTSFPVQTAGVKLAGGQGVLLRGTVVGKDADGSYQVTDSTATTPIEADAILTDDVNTGEAGEVETVTAVAYISGPFNRNALTFGGNDTSATHEETLRTKGIYLKAVI
jgi:hypothetical protein